MSGAASPGVWVDSDEQGGGVAQPSSCSICALEDATCLCEECGCASCLECFEVMHAHESRRAHRRVPLPLPGLSIPSQSASRRAIAPPLGGGMTIRHAPRHDGDGEEVLFGAGGSGVLMEALAVPSAEAAHDSPLHLEQQQQQAQHQEQQRLDDTEQKAQRAAAKRAQFLRSSFESSAPCSSDHSHTVPPALAVAPPSLSTSSSSVAGGQGRWLSAHTKQKSSTEEGAAVLRREEEERMSRVLRLVGAAEVLRGAGEIEGARRVCMAAVREGLTDAAALDACSDLLARLGDTCGAEELQERSLVRKAREAAPPIQA